MDWREFAKIPVIPTSQALQERYQAASIDINQFTTDS
jgi:hypothetical protein